MRLIDADAMLTYRFKNDISWNAFCNLIKRVPTVDAVPVVRCKDCKYNANNPVPFYDDDPILTYAWCNTECFDENGFCSCGKRIDNG